MVHVREIEFNEALSCLQGLIGSELQIIINFYGTFCGCYLTGSLVRIDTLAPDDAVVDLVIGERNGILLDPSELVEILLAGDLDDGGASSTGTRSDGASIPRVSMADPTIDLAVRRRAVSDEWERVVQVSGFSTEDVAY